MPWYLWLLAASGSGVGVPIVVFLAWAWIHSTKEQPMSNPITGEQYPDPADFPEVSDPELDPDILPDDPAESVLNPDEPQE